MKLMRMQDPSLRWSDRPYMFSINKNDSIERKLYGDPLSEYRKNNSQFPDNLDFLSRLMKKLIVNAFDREWLSVDVLTPKLRLRFHPRAYTKIKDTATYQRF